MEDLPLSDELGVFVLVAILLAASDGVFFAGGGVPAELEEGVVRVAVLCVGDDRLAVGLWASVVVGSGWESEGSRDAVEEAGVVFALVSGFETRLGEHCGWMGSQTSRSSLQRKGVLEG